MNPEMFDRMISRRIFHYQKEMLQDGITESKAKTDLRSYISSTISKLDDDAVVKLAYTISKTLTKLGIEHKPVPGSSPFKSVSKKEVRDTVGYVPLKKKRGRGTSDISSKSKVDTIAKPIQDKLDKITSKKRYFSDHEIRAVPDKHEWTEKLLNLRLRKGEISQREFNKEMKKISIPIDKGIEVTEMLPNGRTKVYHGKKAEKKARELDKEVSKIKNLKKMDMDTPEIDKKAKVDSAKRSSKEVKPIDEVYIAFQKLPGWGKLYDGVKFPILNAFKEKYSSRMQHVIISRGIPRFIEAVASTIDDRYEDNPDKALKIKRMLLGNV